jgi:hypothetical protein
MGLGLVENLGWQKMVQQFYDSLSHCTPSLLERPEEIPLIHPLTFSAWSQSSSAQAVQKNISQTTRSEILRRAYL